MERKENEGRKAKRETIQDKENKTIKKNGRNAPGK